jgi:glutamyl-tRNA synthetase
MLRFSLSLADDLTITGLRIAAISWTVARQQERGWMLRFQETDPACNTEEKETEIKQILEKFALSWDHLLYQSESLHRHQQLAVSLLEQGKAFVCTCAPETIEAQRETAKRAGKPYRYNGQCEQNNTEDLHRIRKENIPYVIRIKLPDEPITFDDTIRGEITTPPEEIDRFVILHADGTPTQDFACAVDDMLGNISTVILAEEDRDGTPRQIHIRQQLGYDQPLAYVHLPGIRMPEGSLTIKALLEEGFLPDTILNYLLLPDTQSPTEVFTLPEAVKRLDLHKLPSSEIPLERETLRFLNREHLRRMDDKAASALYGFADADIGRLVKLYLEEASTLSELDIKIRPILAPKPCEGEWEEPMRRIAAQIETMPVFKTFDAFRTYIAEKTGLQNERLLHALRRLLTGAKHGPDLAKIYPLIQSYLLEVARCPH